MPRFLKNVTVLSLFIAGMIPGLEWGLSRNPYSPNMGLPTLFAGLVIIVLFEGLRRYRTPFGYAALVALGLPGIGLVTTYYITSTVVLGWPAAPVILPLSVGVFLLAVQCWRMVPGKSQPQPRYVLRFSRPRQMRRSVSAEIMSSAW